MTCRGQVGAPWPGVRPECYAWTMSSSVAVGLFPALLRRWRRARGLSQLELSSACGVSTRHLSCLENGRANPSRGMVLRLGEVLDVPLRHANELLRAAGLEEAYAEPSLEEALEGSAGRLLMSMLEAHDPLPMVIMNRRYDLVRASRGAERLMTSFCADPTALEGGPLNLYTAFFDPRICRPFVVGWSSAAEALRLRLHREVLETPRRPELAALLEEVEALIEGELPEVDLAASSPPHFQMHLRRGSLELRFVGTVTAFSTPQNVTLSELRIESWFPADEPTRRWCHDEPA